MLLFTSTETKAHGQETISLEIHGIVIDDSLLIPVAYPEIEIATKTGQTFNVKGDSLGIYELKENVEAGQQKFILTATAENQITTKLTWDTVITRDANFEQPVRMKPASICWDSFLPTPIIFDKDKSELKKVHLNKLLYWIREAPKSLDDVFEKKSVEIIAYSSFNESEQVAKKRGEYIYNLFLENGLHRDDITLEIKGTESFFYCEYCDGCHYYFLKGKGVELSKELIDKETDNEITEEYQQMRRIVELKWTNK